MDAGGGVGGYGLKVFDRATGRTIFSGSLVGAGATSTLIALPDGDFTFAVRGCTSDIVAATCGPWGTSDFTVRLATPAGDPRVTFPAAGAVVTSSTNVFTWTAVPGAVSYEVTFRRASDLRLVSHLRVTAPDTATILTLRSGQYVMTVQACASGCGVGSGLVPFEIGLPAAPSDAPVVTAAGLAGNVATIAWTSVTGADLYQVELVQGPPAGRAGAR